MSSASSPNSDRYASDVLKSECPISCLIISGGGRKPKPPGEKRIKFASTMRPDHYDATAGDRSGMIERALDNMFGWLERAKTTTTSTVEVTTGSETNEPIKITIKGYKD